MKKDVKALKEVKTLEKFKKPRFSFSGEILGVFGILVLIVILILILGRIGPLSQEIMEKRSEIVNSTSSDALEVAKARLNRNTNKVADLNKLFINDDNLVDFVKEIDTLKNEGLINSFSFGASDVRDKRSGYNAIPFEIMIEGDGAKISSTMSKILSLPYFIVDVSAELQLNETGGYTYNYGGFLYISEDYGKN